LGDDWREEVLRSGTVCYRGTFEGWDVIVVEAGAGNLRAATTAVEAITHYQPDLALFVGIAGGVKDVRLTDVVVASKVYNYEFGRDTAGGFFVRPELNQVAHELEQRAPAEPMIRNPLTLASTRPASATRPRSYTSSPFLANHCGHGVFHEVMPSRVTYGYAGTVIDTRGRKTSLPFSVGYSPILSQRGRRAPSLYVCLAPRRGPCHDMRFEIEPAGRSGTANQSQIGQETSLRTP
jgi:hypothetical protein